MLHPRRVAQQHVEHVQVAAAHLVVDGEVDQLTNDYVDQHLEVVGEEKGGRGVAASLGSGAGSSVVFAPADCRKEKPLPPTAGGGASPSFGSSSALSESPPNMVHVPSVDTLQILKVWTPCPRLV